MIFQSEILFGDKSDSLSLFYHFVVKLSSFNQNLSVDKYINLDILVDFSNKLMIIVFVSMS